MSDMSIIFRYVFTRFLIIFCVVLLSLSFVIGLFDVIELLREAAKHDLAISFGSLILMSVFKLPQMVYVLLPFVALITSIIFLFHFTKTSELIVMRSVGLSVWNFTFPMVVATLLIGIGQIFLFSPFSAWMSRQYERMEEKWGFTSSSPFSFSEDGLWLRQNTSDGGTLVIRAGCVRQTENLVALDDVMVLHLAKDGNLINVAYAQESMLGDRKLILENAFVMDNEKETRQVLPQLSFETDFTLDRILEKFDAPETMSFWRFPSFIRFLNESGFSSLEHRMYWHNMWAFPLFLITMLAVGVTFSLTKTARQARFLLRLILALGAGFLFYFLERVSQVAGFSQALPIVLAAWVPVLIVLPLCISALLHLEDG